MELSKEHHQQEICGFQKNITEKKSPHYQPIQLFILKIHLVSVLRGFEFTTTESHAFVVMGF